MKYLDTKTGKFEELIDVTSNSYCITQSKLTDKGIDCTNWFSEKDFHSRFLPLTSN